MQSFVLIPVFYLSNTNSNTLTFWWDFIFNAKFYYLVTNIKVTVLDLHQKRLTSFSI